jgi:ABC-type lipoprotein export system ATPase subunit
MIWIAIRMLTGDSTKFFGLVFGVAFSTLLIAQQLTIFVNLVGRGGAQVNNIPSADIWVMDPSSRTAEVSVAMPSTDLYRVRGVTGVAWAVPLIIATAVLRTPDGDVEGVSVIGVDNETLIGLPRTVLSGTRDDLAAPDAIFVDGDGALKLFPETADPRGIRLELNDRRAVVRGTVDANPSFTSSVLLYTRYSNALNFVPGTRNRMSFVLVRAANGVDPVALAERIEAETGLKARSRQAFARAGIDFIIDNTGHSDQLRHHRRAGLRGRGGDRRADLQPVHPRQYQAVRGAEGDRRHQWHDPADGGGAGRAGGLYRLWHRGAARRRVHLHRERDLDRVQGLLFAVADPDRDRGRGDGDDPADRIHLAARGAEDRSGRGVPMSPAKASAEAIAVRGIVKDFPVGGGHVRVLHGIDVAVRTGELTYLVGESGSGKTTLISIIAGILSPTEGGVRVFGTDIYALSDGALVTFRLRTIGFIFQQYNLLPALTAAENAAVPLIAAGMNRGEAVARARVLLDKLGIGDQADKYQRQLSGGQQQRVAIARALVHEPRLVVCDEPYRGARRRVRAAG